MLRKVPQSFSEEYRGVLRYLMFSSDAKVVGSAGEKEILYSGDVDVMDTLPLRVETLRRIRQQVVALDDLPFVRVTDIKCGQKVEWNLLRKPTLEKGVLVGYNRNEELETLGDLWKKNIVTDADYKTARSLLKNDLTPVDFLRARKALRFGVFRWEVSDVEQGFLKLRDGSVLTLEDACTTSPFKVDAVTYFPRHIVEFSSIVLWSKEARLPDYETAIREDILVLAEEGNWFKVAKRIYLLEKVRGNREGVAVLRDLFNSPLGFLYVVVSNLELMEEVGAESGLEKESVRNALDEMRMKYAKLPIPLVIPRVSDVKVLRKLLQEKSREALMKTGYYPIPADFTP